MAGWQPAYSQSVKLMNEEKKALREEKKELRATITAQQGRIDTLHNQVFQIESGEDTE